MKTFYHSAFLLSYLSPFFQISAIVAVFPATDTLSPNLLPLSPAKDHQWLLCYQASLPYSPYAPASTSCVIMPVTSFSLLYVTLSLDSDTVFSSKYSSTHSPKQVNNLHEAVCLCPPFLLDDAPFGIDLIYFCSFTYHSKRMPHNCLLFLVQISFLSSRHIFQAGHLIFLFSFVFSGP